MPITLQSAVGGFSSKFMRGLPGLEKAMIAHGLDPSQFVISKDAAMSPSVPFIGPFFYDYTVFVGEDRFTVSEPNDVEFLNYLHQRLIAAEAGDQASPPRHPGLIGRIFRRIAQPITE